MDLTLTEEQKMFQNTVRDFAKKELEPVAESIDQNEEYPFDNIKKLAQLGITGLTIPEEYGGSGGTFVDWCIAMEEIAHACAATASILDTSWGLGCHCLYAWGNEEQKKRYVTPLAKGEKIAAFGLTEANAGSDPLQLETTAVKDGNAYVINGSKIFISNGDVADFIVVFATEDKSLGHRGMSAFIVEKGTPGFSVGSVYRKLGIRAAHNAELLFEGCRIPAENLLGGEGQGFKVALSTLDGARIAIAAIAVGIARAALEASTAHAKQHQQYGQPIASLQAIQWMLSDMATGIDAARLLAYRAASLKDRGHPFTTEAAMAKVFASEVAMAATTKAIQIHGGYGYMMDSPIQRYFRDAKITEIYEGTSEIMRLIIARNLLR
ncbi:Acyl-CoA dehydrogenase, short-chain specific [subsurface metagenome]